jgi:hypothetical protein
VEQWSARESRSASISLTATPDSGLVLLLQDPFSTLYNNNSSRGPSSSKGPRPRCKVIKPLSVKLFNVLMSFSLQILEVKICSDSRSLRGQFRIRMTGSAVTVAREVTLLVLAPNHVLAPTRLLQHSRLLAATTRPR